MTDSKALRALIKERGLKLKYVAAQMNLSPYGLQRKIDNLSEFNTNEVTLLCKAIGGLSIKDQHRIFFAK